MTAAGGATICVPFRVGTVKVTRRATYSSHPSTSSGTRAPLRSTTAAGLMLNSRGGPLSARMCSATSSAMSTGFRWLAFTTSDGRPSGNRPGGSRPGGSRPQKYGPHAREVIAARRYGHSRAGRAHPNGRNPGDVWSVPTRPYRGPHFAAFPPEIPARCIKAGCKPGGMVLDPFCGTGTTGLAALTLDRRFTGIDLNPAFAALAAGRLRHEPERGVGDADGNQ